MRYLPFLACGLLVLSGIPSVRMAGQTTPIAVDVAPFRSVELRHGGRAFLRYGPTQRVTFLKGGPAETQVTVTSGGLLVEKCKRKCDRGYELEILTPDLARITVAEGGTIQSQGSFPQQAEIDVTVNNGGTIDVRSMSVASINASVISGGRIFTKPLAGLVASVVDGGIITYWGDAPVTSSIQHGGVITKGTTADAAEPLAGFSPVIAPVPPTPPRPAIKAPLQ